MNISQTIKHLEQLKSEHGELDVFIVKGKTEEVSADENSVYAFTGDIGKKFVLFDLGT